MKKLLLLGMTLTTATLEAQENLSYQLPPNEILQLADYTLPPRVSMDSKKEYLVQVFFPTYKTLEDLNQEELRLGGLRINPKLHISSTVTYAYTLKVGKIGSGEPRAVKGLPANARIAYITWSPGEDYLAFTNTTAEGVELWLVELKKNEARRLAGPKLNASQGSPFTWHPNNHSLLVRFLPDSLPPLQDRSRDLPTGPVVSVSEGKESQNRTYQDLLKNPTDEYNFRALLTCELHQVDLHGKSSLFKPAALYTGESYSPNGSYLMVSRLEEPFSYLVPYNRFPTVSTVYDGAGKVVREVNRTPLQEIMPKGFMATSPYKRGMAWRPDRPSTLYYVQALDGGDPAMEAQHRDALYVWEAPFSGEPGEILRLGQRYAGVQWGNEDFAVVSDQWYDTRSLRTYAFSPGNPAGELRLIWDRNFQDRYADPGDFQTERNEYGRRVLALRNDEAFLLGDGYTPEGQYPFIDRLNTNTFETTRWYKSDYTDKLERLISIEAFDGSKVLVQIQSPVDFPNYYFRDLAKGTLTPVTSIANPFAALSKVRKEVITYTRKDGVELSGTLYLPAGYDPEKDGRLPLLIWAYPREYKDKGSAGQNTQNANEFTYPHYGSFVYWVTRGYAVLDDAAFPIVGEGGTEPNDNFIEQLVSSAEAAIQAVADRGVADPARVAVGGHSYGAFMTANLLTHSNLFVCGIARSGAYNRTLTPFGFQSEQRNYWDAPEVYNTMSPFMNAHKMKLPLLLVHGEADNNPGTFTLQTERYFQALKGLGASVRMVILPKESHGYAARENILHLLWEQDVFLEKHLKGTAGN